jgi:dephospho-CoA kinase
MSAPHRPGTTAVVGLTGGIACGKSSVAAHFRAWGAHIIDADALAREVVAPGEPALAALVRAFGETILSPDGTLDRKGLGRRVFGDARATAQLNAITHPAIAARTGKRLAEAQRSGLSWVIYEAALILENKIHAGLNALVVVLCPPETQLARLLARSDLSESEARARIASQTTDEVRREHATWLIDNAGTPEQLEAASREVFEAIRQRYGDLPSTAAIS